VRIAFIDYVCDPAKPGTTGLSDLVWDMASHLARAGEDVRIIGPYTTENYPQDNVLVHRFALPPINYRNILGHLLIILRAQSVLRQFGPVDIIHVPEYVSAAVLATLQRTPVVFTEPGSIFDRERYGNPYDWTTTQVYKLAARRAARLCAHCIATSDWMKGWWQWTGVTPDRITYIPLGVDLGTFRQTPNAKSSLGWDPQKQHIVYAARLSRENGADVTLRAFARVYGEQPRWRLHMLGDGPERQAFEYLAADLGLSGAVEWHGWVDLAALPAFYSGADVFVFSGASGGTPRVLLQAMACGAPCVASAIGGITDHIQHGETGLLCQPGTASDLAEQILVVLKNPPLARHLGEAGQKYVRATLDWALLIRQIHSVYARVIEPRADKSLRSQVAV